MSISQTSRCLNPEQVSNIHQEWKAWIYGQITDKSDLFTDLLIELIPINPISKNRSSEKQISHNLKSDLFKNLGPQAHVSISHNPEWIIGIGTHHPEILKIGVDIESSERKISAPLLHRFATPAECDLKINPIQLWVIKEAAFKANLSSAGTFVSQYLLKTWDPDKLEGLVHAPGKTESSPKNTICVKILIPQSTPHSAPDSTPNLCIAFAALFSTPNSG